jgi:membrane protein DedA with SNARE-associated domain
MIETLQGFIADFGAFAVAIGCLFEGETAILLGVFGAHRGWFSLESVVIAATLATILGDNLCFHIGRRMGRPALDRRPGWQPKIARVERLLERYGAPVMIGFRFLYGLRYVTPFLLGSLGVSPLRFFLLASFGTVLWVGTVTFVGVHLAGAIEHALAHIQDVEKILVAIVLVGAGLGVAIYWMRRSLTAQR